jgi:hypothetical protein
VWRNPTEAFFAPLQRLAALRRLDFHNMPRRGGASYRRNIHPGRAATAPKDEIWHLPPLPQMRDYRQLHWTASVPTILVACPGLLTLHIAFEALVCDTRAIDTIVCHATLRTLRLENPYSVEDRAVEHGVVALILKLGHRRMRHGQRSSPVGQRSIPAGGGDQRSSPVGGETDAKPGRPWSSTPSAPSSLSSSSASSIPMPSSILVSPTPSVGLLRWPPPSLPSPRRTLTIEVPWCHNPFPDDVECGLCVRRLTLRRHQMPTCICSALASNLRHCSVPPSTSPTPT